jgi:eukaryotic-like serine/threonine-protein kinase
MQRIGRYEIIDELGRGAMGVVYRARDTQIGRIVALKVILTKSGPPEEVEHYKQRFQREAQAAGRLSHPGIVTLHDIAEDSEGQPYIVMEFIEGEPLSLLFGPAGQAPLDRVLDIGIQVAQALNYAHRSGVVHRDIKPENIMVTHEGRAKITDFGIAKLAGADLTQEGTSLGTPSYMSPEQIRGSAVDARADLFSLGAVLYWMCTGQKPFAGESVTTITFQVVFQDPARAQALKPGLPSDLDRILSRCLAKNPQDRYPSCGELAADLEALRAGRPLAPAAPAGSPPTERTAALPAALVSATRQHGNTTLPLDTPIDKARPISTASNTTAAAVPPASATVSRLRRPRNAWLSGLVVVLFAALVGAGYWLRHPPAVAESSALPSAPVPTPRPPTASNSPEKSAAPPAPSVPKPEAPLPLSAATSKLEIVCKHNFESAILEIDVDDRKFYRGPLHGTKQGRLVTHFEGRLRTERPIPPGRHLLRVRVVSPRDKYDDQDAIQGEFTEGEARTLLIEFGKGSGLGVTERNLNLTLR